MKLHPRVTQAAVDLVKRFEGFRPRAAKTPDGRFTIGYGHVLSPRDSAAEAEISEPEAEFLLRHDLSVVAEAVEESLLAPVNENQFAALLSFAFNIGVDNFKGSSALRRLNEGAYLQAAAALELWRRADFGGDTLVVDQLVRRRAVEKALFLAPPEGFMPLPSSVLRPAFDHSVIGAAVAWATARERTAVSRIALEGPEAAASLLTPPGREGELAPSAAIAAADALAVRLNRVLPEEAHSDADAAPEGATPPLPVAEPVVEAPPLVEIAGQAEPSHAPADDAVQSESVEAAVEPPPLIVAPLNSPPEASPLGLWRRRLTRPEFARPVPPAPTHAAALSLPFGETLGDEDKDAPAVRQAEPAPAPPLFERPLFFAVLGLTGAALFVGSIFCMVSRASITCLLIGVLGVLAMAPAAAFFLFRFLGKPVDLTADEHAALAARLEPSVPHPVEPDPAATPANDPFETTES